MLRFLFAIRNVKITHMSSIPPNLKGLSSKEAKDLLSRYGTNEIVKSKPLSFFSDLFLRFKNPLIFILVLAAVISFLFGEGTESLIIVIIVFTSVMLDFINTHKSQKAAEKLKEHVKITATVLRDGSLREISLASIVPGDIVFLSPGDIIPADGKIIEAQDFFINESSLTGESFPTEKEKNTSVYMGSSAITGTAFVEVEATGHKTKFSHIAEMLLKREEPTEFDRNISDFSFLITKITIVLVAFVFFVKMFGHSPLLESFLFAVALAVGLTPELLPMIIALNLSKGSLAMAKHGVIVKKLSAIQNIGSMDILCTDKTGTLTEDKITLVRWVDGYGKDSENVFHNAYINSYYQSGLHNPLDAAVKETKKVSMAGYRKVEEIPFDYLRKRNSIVVENDGKHILITKGAPEELFHVSKFYDNDREHLTEDRLKELKSTYTNLSKDGFRVLGVAVKIISEIKEVYKKDDEEGMTFIGFIAFLDPPKKTVAATLRVLKEHGIEIKIITGDNELVTNKIAREIGLESRGTLMGSEIEHMSDDALRVNAENNTVFARISPDQKTRIVQLLRQNGHTVGYLGDGINDAPSIKAADIGISVNNAVDVAKESADLILVRKSLHELIEGVIEGRKTFSNTMKYLMMSLSSSFGNMFSMAGISIFLPFLPMLPAQILLNNLIYDSSQFAIPLDNVDPESIKKPKKFSIKFIKRFMLVFGSVSSLFDFITFGTLFFVFKLPEHAFQTGWFLESLATQSLVVYIIRSSKLSFSKSRPSLAIVSATLAAVLIGVLIVFSRLGTFFHFFPLHLTTVLTIAAIVIVYLGAVEITKMWFYKKLSTGNDI